VRGDRARERGLASSPIEREKEKRVGDALEGWGKKSKSGALRGERERVGG
jgi:hypothetical protein